MRPLTISAFLSTPTTFSPTTTGTPHNAQPVAKEFQYFAATKVEPKAPVITGYLHVICFFCPIFVSRFTSVKSVSPFLAILESAPFAP